MRWRPGHERETFREFAELVERLPAERLTRADALDSCFVIYTDRRVEIYYAPFDYVNDAARVVLVGVTPGPTQMLEAYETARTRLRAGQAPEPIWHAGKEQASFKGMRERLSRWLDEIHLHDCLGLDSCAQLFASSPGSAMLHTTPAIRYPTSIRRTDGGLRNYDGQRPNAVEHPMLSAIVHDVLVPELTRLSDALVLPIGKANAVIEHLCATGAIARKRCILGLPHPSPASLYREQYFRHARDALRVQTRDLRHPRARRGIQPARAGATSSATPSALIVLTAGNIRNSHIYLRHHLDLFPAAAIGPAAARDGRGQSLTLHYDGLADPVITDIAARSPDLPRPRLHQEVRQPQRPSRGDTIRITRISTDEYEIAAHRRSRRPPARRSALKRKAGSPATRAPL